MQSSRSVRSYANLSELYNGESVGPSFDQNSDFTIHKLEEVHLEPIVSPTFRANYYSFVLMDEGESSYSIDGTTFPVKPKTLYFTNPGHLKSFNIKKVKGYIITTSEAYLKKYIHKDIFSEFSFLLTEMVPPCYLDAPKFNDLLSLAKQIETTRLEESILKEKVSSSFFLVLLLKIKEHLLADTHFNQAHNRNSQIVKTFKKDLEKFFREMHKHANQSLPQVQDFATLQQLHPTYFSTVIKTKTGKSALQWIQKKLQIEAEALLLNSKTSIKEIAYSLGFKEPSHFTKFFKSKTGKSPGTFRKQGLKEMSGK
ncbi:helix-turn-helix domain-containing protein [Flavobacteriaceae bacterium M23B6Z8]